MALWLEINSGHRVQIPMESSDRPAHDSREVEFKVQGKATYDGAGVKLTRVLTRSLQHRLDPFLMLDEFRSDKPGDYIGGFPDHPHRGFETITYLIAGRMHHRDNRGGEGILEPGGVQWMTAGRGIIHSEMPEQSDGLLHGFQLWLNLPALAKMSEPWYRDFGRDEIPLVRRADGLVASVIAGNAAGVSGAISRSQTAPLIVDLQLAPGTAFTQPLNSAHNAFVYLYAGQASIGRQRTPVGAQTLAVLGNAPEADHVLVATEHSAARALLVAGSPLGEPIVQHGPFVMNNSEQIAAAIADYQSGQF